MTTPLDFSVLQQAGVAQAQFAELCGVSRETVNAWINGKGKPRRARVTHIAKILSSLRQAVNRGVLPAKADTHLDATKRVLDTLAASQLKG